MGAGGGQSVLARDQHDPAGPLRACRISRTYRRTAHSLQVLRLRDEPGHEQTLRVTDEHPFHLAFGVDAWIPAKSLAAGDTILGGDSTLSVVSNEPEAHPAGVTVYNLEVEDAHTYFVLAADAPADAEAVWVHNAGYRQRAIDNQSALTESGMVKHLDPRTNEMGLARFGDIDGDHVLPKQAFKDAIRDLQAEGVTLTRAQLKQVSSLMNSADNLRPMLATFNRSKQDMSGKVWAGIGTDISKSVNSGYIDNVESIQASMRGRLDALMTSFRS